MEVALTNDMSISACQIGEVDRRNGYECANMWLRNSTPKKRIFDSEPYIYFN